MDTNTVSLSRPVSVLAVVLGAVGTLIVVGILSLTYFRPHDAFAVQGASTVVCGSPDLLLTPLSGIGIATFTTSASSTKQLLSCSSPFGGTTQNISLRLRRNDTATKVTYNIYLDGSPNPLLTLTPDLDPAARPVSISGWQIDKEYISTTIPIKFNSTLTISATVTNSGAADVVGGHVQFIPEAQEVPVKFLNVPLINVNGPIHSIIDGQPIQVRDQH